jgi:redox-sensitive bicupin YhaK (pirin superfamily)
MTIMDEITPRPHDLGGGFMVRRCLPSAKRQAVGPFLFFDHFGPVTLAGDRDTNVLVHPHIGLATVTYLFEGAMIHRDSTGAVQRIEPGAVNWMTAGCGVAHSERTPDDLVGKERCSHGLQLWSALPTEHEEDAPSFSHIPVEAIPVYANEGVEIRVLVGEAFGLRSLVKTLSPTLYLDIRLDANAELLLPALAKERAIYVVEGALTIDGVSTELNTMYVLEESATPQIRATTATRLVVIGGEPLGHRFMVWNFVSSSKERIIQAQQDWAEQRFEKVPGETEFIPLPPPRVNPTKT